jgi:hypothetical protein
MNYPTTMLSLLPPADRRLVRSLTTPPKIQAFLDATPYSAEDRYRCPLTVLRDRKAHCFDGAVFAAAMLRRLGHPARIVDMLPNARDDDHMLALFQMDSYWGAVAKSNFSGLRYREPIFRSLRELVLSYFEDYFNAAGEKTLRAYTLPLNLARFDRQGWQVRDETMDTIAGAFGTLRKVPVLTRRMAARLQPVDPRSLAAGLLDSNAAGLFKVKSN